MKKIAIAAGAALTLTLAACGSADDANAPAEVDTVEMPADEVMAEPGMAEDPAVDPALAEIAEQEAEEAAARNAEAMEQAAEDSAQNAVDAAADLEAALNEE